MEESELGDQFKSLHEGLEFEFDDIGPGVLKFDFDDIGQVLCSRIPSWLSRCLLDG